MKIKDLAESLGYKQSNFSNKLRDNNFSEKELVRIAQVLNCNYTSLFTLKDTREQI